MAAGTAERVAFLDGLRGLAIIIMVINHTARWWLNPSVGLARYHLIYLTVVLSAPLFLFLVGFCLPLSYLHARGTGGPGSGHVAAKYVRRGLLLVPLNWLLTLLVFPDEPLFGSEVLQTIGLSIVGLAPILPLLSRRIARPAALALALGWSASFELALPWLREWLPGHPVVSEVWFTGFPIWPWFAFPLLGAVLGWAWMDGHRTDPDDRKFMTALLAAGLVCLAAFLPLELWLGRAPLHFSSRRDLVLNNHWNPGAVTCLFILGYIFIAFPLVHYAMETRRWRPAWLIVLGQNALVLYFVHQVIARSLVRQRLGVQLESWGVYVLATAALIALLVGLGWWRPEITWRVRSAARRTQPSAAGPVRGD